VRLCLSVAAARWQWRWRTTLGWRRGCGADTDEREAWYTARDRTIEHPKLFARATHTSGLQTLTYVGRVQLGKGFFLCALCLVRCARVPLASGLWPRRPSHAYTTQWIRAPTLTYFTYGGLLGGRWVTAVTAGMRALAGHGTRGTTHAASVIRSSTRAAQIAKCPATTALSVRRLSTSPTHSRGCDCWCSRGQPALTVHI